jgi:hypothetical protein
MSLHLVASDTGRVFCVDRAAACAHVRLVRCALESDASADTLRAHMPAERVLDALVEWIRLCSACPYREAVSRDGDCPLRVSRLVPAHHLDFLRTHAQCDLVWFDQHFVPECDRLMVDDLLRMYTLVVAAFAHDATLDVIGGLGDTDAYTRALGAFIRKIV